MRASVCGLVAREAWLGGPTANCCDAASPPPPAHSSLGCVVFLQKARNDLPCSVLAAIRQFGDGLTADPRGWSQALRCFQRVIVRLTCAQTWAMRAAVCCFAVCVQAFFAKVAACAHGKLLSMSIRTLTTTVPHSDGVSANPKCV